MKKTTVEFVSKAPDGSPQHHEHLAVFDEFVPIPEVGDTITYTNPFKTAGSPPAVHRKVLSRHFNTYDGESVHVCVVVEEVSHREMGERVPKP